MTAIVRPEPGSGADLCATAPRLLLNALAAHKTRVVHVTGEVDLATRDQLVSESTEGHHPQIVIDLGGVTFMDYGGYSAHVASHASSKPGQNTHDHRPNRPAGATLRHDC